jgi:hypothetical protein
MLLKEKTPALRRGGARGLLDDTKELAELVGLRLLLHLDLRLRCAALFEIVRKAQ